MQTLERKISDKVRCELENVEATVEIRVHAANFFAKDVFVILRVELEMKSANVSLARTLNRGVLDSNQMVSAGNIFGLHSTGSIKFNLNTNLDENWWDNR